MIERGARCRRAVKREPSAAGAAAATELSVSAVSAYRGQVRQGRWDACANPQRLMLVRLMLTMECNYLLRLNWKSSRIRHPAHRAEVPVTEPYY